MIFFTLSLFSYLIQGWNIHCTIRSTERACSGKHWLIVTYIAENSIKQYLLGRGFFVFPPWSKWKKKPLPGRVYHSSAFISICPKVWTGKYQDHLVLDCISSGLHDRKTIMTWQRFLFSFLSKMEIQRKQNSVSWLKYFTCRYIEILIYLDFFYSINTWYI